MPVIDIPYNCTCGAFWPAIQCPCHTPAGTWFTPPLHTYTRSTLAAPSSLSGLTGLVQVNLRDDLEKDEIERYLVYYAKYQSLMLDLEILSKSLSRRSL